MTTPSYKNTESQILAYRIANFLFNKKYSLSHLSIIVLVIAAIFFIQDIYVDVVVEGKNISHIFIEASVFLGICLALALEVTHAMKLTFKVTDSQEENSRLKKHINELIHEEFRRWDLTKTEQEIAIMLIKGLSMKEIAEIRNVKEKSVRQQATGIYSKSNLGNRYELTSHFIEDLLAPVSN